MTYKPSDVQSDGVRVLRSSNINEDIFVLKTDDVFVKSEAANIEEIKNGDILITSANGSSRLVGKHAIIDGINEKTVHGGFMLVARAKNPQFTNALMSSGWYSKFIDVFVSGGNGAIGNLSKTDLETQKILVPIKVEQEKIGSFFKELDTLITLHQRKYDKTINIKNVMLEKIFPKDSENLPEIIFSKFAVTWEQRKLGNLTQIKTGSSDLQDSVEDGQYPFFVRSENIERSNRYIFDGEAILIPGEGRLGDIYHYINGKFDFHQRVYKISGFEDSNTDGKYILYYMQKNFKQHAMRFTVKATVDSLRLPMLTDFDVVVPKIEEQRKISNLFANLDSLITLHQRELRVMCRLSFSYYFQKKFSKIKKPVQPEDHTDQFVISLVLYFLSLQNH